MFKKAAAIALILSLLLFPAACGNEAAQEETTGSQSSSEASAAAPAGEAESGEPAEPEESAPQLSAEEKRLPELAAETNPANKYEELIAARDICMERFNAAVASAERAGLSEDETISELTAQWLERFGNLRDYLAEFEEMSGEERSALDEDEDFVSHADYYMSALSKIFNMTRALEKDPALWLSRYTTVPQSETELLETDGSWPEGIFFSERVPALEHIDALMMSETGGEYGFEGGLEYALIVFEAGEDEALAYVDQLAGAGFREEIRQEGQGLMMWFGRKNDSEGHISAALVYMEDAGGTAESPALMVQFYSYDAVGLLIDIGSIY